METLDIATSGLRMRNRIDSVGTDETGFLGTIYEIVNNGRTPAEEKLEKFYGEWGENIRPLFDEYAY